MADVRLDFYDLDAEELPDICMRCGQPSTVRPVKSFRWMPPWARFVPPIIGVWFIKRRRALIPLCDQHKNHWVIRWAIGLGGLVLFLVLLFAGAFAMAASEGNNANGPLQYVGIALLALAALLLIAWLIAMIVLAVTQINAVEITEDTITLKNVHSDFTRAYREMTRGSITPEVEEIVREEWGKSSGRLTPKRNDYPPDDKYRRG